MCTISGRRRALGALVVTALTLPTTLFGQAVASRKQPNRSPEPGPTPGVSGIERERLDFDREKWAAEQAAERARVALEREKLVVERDKERSSFYATLGTWAGILLTFGYSVWSFRKQSEFQARAQQHAAQLQFEIKAAEIAFAGKTPQAVLNRGRALKKMFGDRLPDSFLDQFDPKNFGGDKETPEPKQALLELLMQHADKQPLVLKLWSQLFPGDHEWLKRINPNA